MSAPESAIGLEIGLHYVKAVRLVRRLGRPQLVAAEILRLPKDRGNLAEIIHRFLESKDLLNYPCAICTPAFSAMLHTIEVAENDPRTDKDVVAIEINRLNDISEEEMLYDFVKLPESAVRQSILIAMGRKSAIERMLHIPDAIGLDVVHVTPIPVAVFNGSLPRRIPHTDIVVCANIRHAATHVAIGNRHGILFSRHFDHGGDAFTAAVADCMDLNEREAEDLKLHHGFNIDTVDNGRSGASAALRSAADDWIGELRSTLEFYRERYPLKEEQPRHLALSGGGADLAGLFEYLAVNIDLDVQRFEPPWSGRNPQNAGRFVVAGGLALTALKKTRMQLNLLPPERKAALELKAQIPYWKIVGAALALMLLVVIVAEYMGYRRQQAYAKTVAERVAEFHHMDRDLQELKQGNARLADRLRFAHRGMRDGMILRAIVGAITHVMHPDDWLILVADSDSYFGGGTAGEPAFRPANGTGVDAEGFDPHFLEGIIVEGYTPHEDFATVKTMIEKLRDIPYVETVDLLTDDRVMRDPARHQAWTNFSARLFAIEIEVKQP